MATIDSLDIKISAQANSASASIDKLVGRLNTLSSSLNRINGSGLTGLANGVQKLGNAMQVMNTVKTTDFTRLANNLTKLSAIDTASINKAASSVNTIAKSFNNIGNLSKSAEQLGQLASGIKQLGYTSATKAIQNIPKLVTSMKMLMSELSGAPKVSQNLIDMTNALARLARTGASSGRAADSLSRSFTNLSTSSIRTSGVLRGMQNNFRNLFRSILPFVGVFQLISFGKQATEIASDLTEVQNVVDVTFAQFKDRIEDFADTSIQDFGMSELTAKTIASRFQAMGVAMGFARGEMADMSVNLTALAGDMASFYNVAQEDMAKSLQAIFTGETEPLRRYGIDLTNATLQEWAMKQGLDANIQSMTQAEKTLMRYNYVLANTVDAQGDFARTANTWANSIRVLKQNFEALGSIVGQVLINVFKPFVQALNSVMQKVIQFARVVANALGKIFGWKLEINTTGVTDDIGGIADYADQAAGGLESGSDAAKDEADNIDKAQKAAKKLKDYTLGIDELNIIRPEDVDALDDMTNSLDKIDKPSGGAGGAGAGGGGGDVASSLTKTDSIFKEFESEIDSLYELGEYIGKTLTDAMNSIDWDSIYEKARNFGKGLADFLNGLISPELFGALGRTIAGSLNTALHFLDSFGETFDWEDFGLSIATGINEFFATFDFALLAHTINVWAKGILDTIIVAITETDWKMIGERIGTFLSEIDFLEIGMKIGRTIWKAINAGFELFYGIFKKAPLETALISLAAMPNLLSAITASKFVTGIKKLADSIALITSSAKGNYSSISLLISQYPKLGNSVNVALQAFAEFKSGLNSGGIFEGLNQGILTVRNSLTGMQKGIITAASAFLEFNIVSDVFEGLTLGTEGIVEGLLKIGATVAAAGAAMYVALGPAGLAVAAITGVVAAIKGIGDAFDEIHAENIGNAISNALSNPGGVTLDSITNSYRNLCESISIGFEQIGEKSAELNSAKENVESLTQNLSLIAFEIENGVSVTAEKIPELIAQYSKLTSESRSILEGHYQVVVAALSGSLGKAVEANGDSVEKYLSDMALLKAQGNAEISEVEQKLADLQYKFEQNIIDEETFSSQFLPIAEQLIEINKRFSETETETNNFQNTINGIDLSGIVENGEYAEGKVSNILTQLSSAYTKSSEAITSAAEDTEKSLQFWYEESEKLGNSDSMERFATGITENEKLLTAGNAELQDGLKEKVDMLKLGLLDDIPSIVEKAQEIYEGMDWTEKLLSGTEGQYVYDYVQQYKQNVIDPFASQVVDMYNSINLEDEGLDMSEATQNAIDAIFDEEVLHNAAHTKAPLVKESWKGAFDEAFDNMAEEAGYGKDFVDGYAKGIEENKRTVLDASKSMVNAGLDAIPETQKSGSPSKITEQYGIDFIDGYILGIKNKATELLSIIKEIAQNAITEISNSAPLETWINKFEGIKEAFTLKWQEISNWLNSDFLPTWFEEGIMPWFSFEKWHDELLINIPLAFQTTWEKLLAWWNEEAMTVWWEEYVMPWFEIERWQLQFTNILTALKAVWQEIVITWNLLIDTWWKLNVLPRFTLQKWTAMLMPVKTAFNNTFKEIVQIINERMEEAYHTVFEWCSKMISELEAVMTAIGAISGAISALASVGVSAGINTGISIGVKQYATGGFPDSGDFFFANENGIPELVGTIGGRTAVASGTEITGISNAVYSTGETQASLLNTAIALLQIIADKDMVAVMDTREALSDLRAEADREGFSFIR